MRRLVPALLVAALVMAPPSASAADLVVWWHEGYYTEEDEAVREIIAAFEQESGKQVELVIRPMEELPDKIAAALEVGQPPDFAFGFWLDTSAPQWALEGRLAISRTPSATSPTCSIRLSWTGPRCSTRRRAGKLCTACRWGRSRTSPTSGRASWSRPVSRSKISRESG
jgi:hypothetical protein